jgi:hypothetical protein
MRRPVKRQKQIAITGSGCQDGRSLVGDQGQQRLWGSGEFLNSFVHQDTLESLEIDFQVNLVQHGRARELIDLFLEHEITLDDRLVDGGRIGLNVTAS